MNTVAQTLRVAPRQLRLLPLFLIIAGAVMLFKTGLFVGEVTGLVGTARAQAAETPAPGAAPQSAENVSAEPAAVDPLGGVSRSELELLQDLRKRRDELDEWEKQIALREQLLAATERRVEQKITDLKTVEERIAGLVKTHEQREDEQIASIVKVYETMKPKDAAPIFQRLDLSIQTAVATRMREVKMAAMLAEMDPDAAKVLTTELTKRTRLPGVPAPTEKSGP